MHSQNNGCTIEVYHQYSLHTGMPQQSIFNHSPLQGLSNLKRHICSQTAYMLTAVLLWTNMIYNTLKNTYREPVRMYHCLYLSSDSLWFIPNALLCTHHFHRNYAKTSFYRLCDLLYIIGINCMIQVDTRTSQQASCVHYSIYYKSYLSILILL